MAETIGSALSTETALGSRKVQKGLGLSRKGRTPDGTGRDRGGAPVYHFRYGAGALGGWFPSIYVVKFLKMSSNFVQ